MFPLDIKEPKVIALRSLRPYQEYWFIRVIQTIAKLITTPPGFIAPKRYGRDANCTSVTHTSDPVKFLLYFGYSLSWMAQVYNDKVKAPQPSCHSSWFMIQLNQSSRRKLAGLYSCCVGGRWENSHLLSSWLSSSFKFYKKRATSELLIAHTRTMQASHYCGSSNYAFHIERAHDKAEALDSS